MDLTETQLTAAGFPDELRPYLLSDTLSFSHARPDGTLEFIVPNPDEPKSSFTLVWHPEAPATWDYEGLRFHVNEAKYRDVHHHDPVGDELVSLWPDDSINALIDWLDDLPVNVLPSVPAAVGGNVTRTKPYTVLLLYPDYASGTYGEQTYLAHVTADDPTAAILAARQECDAAYRHPNRDKADGFNDLEDLFVHAVFAGHHDDLKP